jgi:hypothetical protein
MAFVSGYGIQRVNIIIIIIIIFPKAMLSLKDLHNTISVAFRTSRFLVPSSDRQSS